MPIRNQMKFDGHISFESSRTIITFFKFAKTLKHLKVNFSPPYTFYIFFPKRTSYKQRKSFYDNIIQVSILKTLHISSFYIYIMLLKSTAFIREWNPYLLSCLYRKLNSIRKYPTTHHTSIEEPLDQKHLYM